MFEDLLKAAKALKKSHSPPEIPEALSRAIPSEAALQHVKSLLESDDADPVARLWATYAIVKNGKLIQPDDAGRDAETAALRDIAVAVGELMAPVCSGTSLDEEDDDTDCALLALKGSLGLHILDQLTKAHPSALTLQAQSLISIVAFTDPTDPWTTPATSHLARAVLEAHFRNPSPSLSPSPTSASNTTRNRTPENQARPTEQNDALTRFITEDVLSSFLRGLFAKTPRPATVTASGRKAEFVQRTRYDHRGGETEEAADAKPWKYARRYAVTVFAWAVERADQPLLQKHWHKYTPILLTLLDEPPRAHPSTPTTPSLRVRALHILRTFWARCPPGLMRDTGLADVLEQAVFPTVLYLPGLTPEDEAVALLGAAYPALFEMAGVVGPPQTQQEDADDGSDDADGGGENMQGNREFTDAQRRLLDKIVRQGIMVGYHHAKGHVRLVELFCEKLRCLVNGMGILAIKYLKDFMPMVSEIMTDPFGTKHPPALLSATKLLQAILRACWPRIPHYCNEVIKILMLCWLNIEDEELYPAGSPTPTEVRAELTKTAEMLSATMMAARVDMTERVGTLIEKEPDLRSLFKSAEAT
ncbi:Uu.00g051770.m01.CDS01 [Anthostomella pinea]|uniref:Uu.00g051770.m01.CDS01 n=1 Tax=Anthostomella pinea TaxID=933095 RepID=A0AAI8VW57_9PEZI|nr:Uu.00g051770.m01.CDS01 [Anthostomella pinea]